MILKNTRRYINLFYEAVEKIMPKRISQIGDDEIEATDEIVLHQRLMNLNNDENKNRQSNGKHTLPKELTRK
jgi:hypothetical protein